MDRGGEAAALLHVSLEGDVLDDRVGGREPLDRGDRSMDGVDRRLGLAGERPGPGHGRAVAAHPA